MKSNCASYTYSCSKSSRTALKVWNMIIHMSSPACRYRWRASLWALAATLSPWRSATGAEESSWHNRFPNGIKFKISSPDTHMHSAISLFPFAQWFHPSFMLTSKYKVQNNSIAPIVIEIVFYVLKAYNKNSIRKNQLLTSEPSFSIFGCISILNVG